MPAVKTFALYAALAVLMDFILQMTAFVALLSLDARRQDSNRCELLCCVKVGKRHSDVPKEGLLLPLMRNYYAPVLLNNFIRIIVVKPYSFDLEKVFRSCAITSKGICPSNIGVLTEYLPTKVTCVFSADGGVYLHVLCILSPYVPCDRGSGPGALNASGQLAPYKLKTLHSNK